MREGLTPACTCERPDGAHDEKCAYIRHVRSPDYEPDLTLLEFLDRRRKPAPSAFD